MTPPLVQLASYGPLWALLACCLVGIAALGLGFIKLLKWVLTKWHENIAEDLKITRGLTLAATEAMRDVPRACANCRVEIVSVVRTETGSLADRTLSLIRESNKSLVESNGNIVTALGRETDRTVRAVENVLAAVQRDNDQLSQRLVTPPPILGTGSQVRDSAAPLPSPKARVR